MNDNRMKRWMDAIDDDLLEEAQRPLPRGGAAHRWGCAGRVLLRRGLGPGPVAALVRRYR